MSSLPLEPPSRLNHATQVSIAQAGLPHYTHPLRAICFTHGSVYMSILTSQFVPPSLSPLLIGGLYLHLCFCPGNRFINMNNVFSISLWQILHSNAKTFFFAVHYFQPLMVRPPVRKSEVEERCQVNSRYMSWKLCAGVWARVQELQAMRHRGF